jgi:Recombinase zinc beta ribbon domain
MDDLRTVHQGAYPAYISWEEFMTNQARLTDNASRYVERTRGAARTGGALLVGLVVCGRCGRQLHVEYKTHHHYVCSALGKEYGAPLCLYLDGASLDAVVIDAFFQALQPAELDLLDEVLAAQQADHARLAQQYADQVVRMAPRSLDFDVWPRPLHADLGRRLLHLPS